MRSPRVPNYEEDTEGARAPSGASGERRREGGERR